MTTQKKQFEIELKEEEPRKTPLYDRHLALQAKFADFAGWLMPISYTNITQEHLTVRQAVGIFDISHMGELSITGPDAYRYLQRIIAGDLDKITDNQILYTPICNYHGGVIDDLLIYRLSPQEFFLIVNAANTQKDYQWFCENLDGEKVTIQNVSTSWGALAIQGPQAAPLLKKVFNDLISIDSLMYYHFQRLTYKQKPCLISRTGYTGEDGFEIYYKDITNIWDILFEQGKPLGVKPIGLGARDTLRLEMGYSLYGHDLKEKITPFESGIGWTIALHKKDFIGKKAMEELKEKAKIKRVGFALTGQGIPREHCDVKREGQKIGEVSSGTFSPTLKKGIGLAFIDKTQARPGNEITIEIRGKNIPASIVTLPFYQEKRIKNKK